MSGSGQALDDLRRAATTGRVADFRPGAQRIADEMPPLESYARLAQDAAGSEGPVWDGRSLPADDIRQLIIRHRMAQTGAGPGAPDDIIHRRGLRIIGARIDGDVDFYNLHIDFPIRFIGCRIEGEIILEHAQTKTVEFAACTANTISAASARFEGNVKFERARIFGKIDFRSATVTSNVLFTRSELSGEVSFENGRLHGRLDFTDAVIRNALILRNISLHGGLSARNIDIEYRMPVPEPLWKVVDLSLSTIESDVIFSNARIVGGLNILGTAIEGNLDLQEAFLDARQPSRFAILANGLRLASSIRAERCVVYGELRFKDATIDGEVQLYGARLHGAYRDDRKGARAMTLSRARISGDVLFGPNETFKAELPPALPRTAEGITVSDEDRALGRSEIHGTLVFSKATIGGDLNLRWAVLHHGGEFGLAIRASRAMVHGEGIFEYCMTQDTVRLRYTKFFAQVSFEGARLFAPAADKRREPFVAMDANDLSAERDLILGFDSLIEGRIDLHDAKVQGSWICGGAEIRAEGLEAINAVRMEVTGNADFTSGAILREDWERAAPQTDFRCRGMVNFEDAHILGMLDLSGAQFESDIVPAIWGPRLEVVGNLMMAKGFKAEGGVAFRNAVIQGDLDVRGGSVSAALDPYALQPIYRMNGIAFDITSARIAGNLVLGFVCTGARSAPGMGREAQPFQCDGCLVMSHARVSGSVLLRAAAIRARPSRKPNEYDLFAIFAPDLNVEGDFDFYAGTDDIAEYGGRPVKSDAVPGTRIQGTVNLMRAEIGGSLDFSAATILRRYARDGETAANNHDGVFEAAPVVDDRAVAAFSASVGGDLIFSDRFTAVGSVDLQRARIGGQVEVLSSGFNWNANPWAGESAPQFDRREDVALNLARSTIGLDVYVGSMDGKNESGSRFFGRIDLALADITGGFLVENSILYHPTRRTIRLYNARTGGQVEIAPTAVIIGEVSFVGATLMSDLVFWYPEEDDHRPVFINAKRLQVHGTIYWNRARVDSDAPFGASLDRRESIPALAESNGKTETASVGEILAGAGLGGTELHTVGGNRGIDLTGAKASELADSRNGWPRRAKDVDWLDRDEILHLDGFDYASIAEESPKSVEERLVWLRRSGRPNKSGARGSKSQLPAQPMYHLIEVMRGANEHDIAAELDLARLRAANLDRPFLTRMLFSLADLTFGYGYRIRVGLAAIFALFAIGFGTFSVAWENCVIGPTQAEYYSVFDATPGPGCTFDERYPRFQPFVFALDVFVPAVNFHQQQFWGPLVPDSGWRRSLGIGVSVIYWVLICAGWLFTSLALVAVSARVQRQFGH